MPSLTRPVSLARTVAAGGVLALMVAAAALVLPSAEAATATGKTAVRTQLEPSPKITGVKPILWIPAGKTLTLQCLAVGEKAYGAVENADPYYYKVTYAGKTGYAIDADLYTSKKATALGLTYCSIPAEPGKPSASSVSSSSVTLKWSDRSNNETSFRTQYSTNGGKSWKSGPSAKANATSISVTGLASSTKYTFQVGAANNKGTKWSAYAYATTTKPGATPPGKNGWAYPIRPHGKFTTYSGHNGEDVAVKIGTPVYAMYGGKVTITAPYAVTSAWCPVAADLGKTQQDLRVTGSRGGHTYRFAYAHMSSYKVKNGATVKTGDLLGYSGDKGCASGPHLHVDIQKDGVGNQVFPHQLIGWSW